jgi:hypothetical protein
MTDPAPTPRARLVIGLLFVAAGLFPFLAAFDIGPLGRADIQGPPWLGAVAGGIFITAGLAVAFGEAMPLLSRTLGLLTLAGLAAIGNWIAFGAGERACTGTVDLLWFSNHDLSGLACRIPFGLGAAIVDAFLVVIAVTQLQTALGGPPRLARLKKAAGWLLGATLAPILLPIILFLIGWSAVGAVGTRLRTGAWPKNEGFIRRQREARKR